MRLGEKCQVAVRLTEGNEWLDLATATTCGERYALDKAKDVDSKCGPSWLKFNPVVRVATVRLVEEI